MVVETFQGKNPKKVAFGLINMECLKQASGCKKRKRKIKFKAGVLLQKKEEVQSRRLVARRWHLSLSDLVWYDQYKL